MVKTGKRDSKLLSSSTIKVYDLLYLKCSAAQVRCRQVPVKFLQEIIVILLFAEVFPAVVQRHYISRSLIESMTILLNKAGSNKYINTYLIFIRVLLLRVRLVCSRYMGKVRPEHKDFCRTSQIGHLTTLFLLFRTEAKGKKGMSKVSKDVLRVYCTKD